jgi:probable F420-dependent oxidoreductase
MRYGVKVGVDLPGDPAAIVDLAGTVEALGYDGFWVGDHVVIPRAIDHHDHQAQVGGGVAFDDKTAHPVFDPILTLTHIGALVPRIRLGLSVLVLPYRHPVVAAKMLASLDVLSGGRLTVGVGSGWMREEFEVLAVPFEGRGRRTDEYLQVMVELWTQEHPTFNGDLCSIPDVAFLPKPVQVPHPPIWVGGNSTAALRRVVRHGQGWMPNFLTPEELAPKIDQLKRMMEAAGRHEELTIALGCRIASDAVPNGQLSPEPHAMVEDVRRYARLGVHELLLMSGRAPDVAARARPLRRFIETVRGT